MSATINLTKSPRLGSSQAPGVNPYSYFAKWTEYPITQPSGYLYIQDEFGFRPSSEHRLLVVGCGRPTPSLSECGE